MVLLHTSPSNLWKPPPPETSEEELLLAFEKVRQPVLVYGHAHRAFVRNLPGRVIVNSGSVGSPYDGDPRAWNTTSNARSKRFRRAACPMRIGSRRCCGPRGRLESQLAHSVFYSCGDFGEGSDGFDRLSEFHLHAAHMRPACLTIKNVIESDDAHRHDRQMQLRRDHADARLKWDGSALPCPVAFRKNQTRPAFFG